MCLCFIWVNSTSAAWVCDSIPLCIHAPFLLPETGYRDRLFFHKFVSKTAAFPQQDCRLLDLHHQIQQTVQLYNSIQTSSVNSRLHCGESLLKAHDKWSLFHSQECLFTENGLECRTILVQINSLQLSKAPSSGQK